MPLVMAAPVLGRVAGSLVFWMVLFALARLDASPGPMSILGLCLKRTTRAGMFAGLVTGTCVTLA